MLYHMPFPTADTLTANTKCPNMCKWNNYKDRHHTYCKRNKEVPLPLPISYRKGSFIFSRRTGITTIPYMGFLHQRNVNNVYYSCTQKPGGPTARLKLAQIYVTQRVIKIRKQVLKMRKRHADVKLG